MLWETWYARNFQHLARQGDWWADFLARSGRTRRGAFLWILLATFGMAIPGPGAAGGLEVDLIYGSRDSDPGSTQQAISAFGSMISELSEHRIDVQFPEMERNEWFEELKGGGLDLAVLNYSLFIDSDIFEFPFLFEGFDQAVTEHDHAYAVMYEFTVHGLSSMDDGKSDFVGLAMFDYSPRVLASGNKIVKDPRDLSGKSVWTTSLQERTFLESLAGKVGHGPAFRLGNLLNRLATGLGPDIISITLVDYQRWELYRYFPVLTYTFHARVPSVFAISRAAWKKFSAECQDVIRAVARLSALLQWGARERELEQIKDGLHYDVRDYAEIEREKFRERARETWGSKEGRYSAKRLSELEAFETVVDELRAIYVDEEFERWKEMTRAEQEEQGFYPAACTEQ